MFARREVRDGALPDRGIRHDLRRGVRRPLLAQQPARDTAVLAQQQRGRDHAQHDRDQQRLGDLIGHDLAVHQDGEDRDAELAAHRQHDAGAHRLERRQAPKPADERGQQGLAHGHRSEDAEDQQQVALQHAEVQHHADRDEEEAEQDVAERPDRRLDLMTVLGLREHHAGEERAGRHRHAGGMRYPGRSQRHQQHGEREQFLQTAVRDLVEQRPQRVAPDDQHESDRQGTERDRCTDAGGAEIEAARRQRAGEHQERHEREVLEQQHAERDATMRAVDLRLLGQLLDDDRRGAHRDRAAERHRGEQIDAERMEHQHRDARQGHDLHAAHAEHLAAHRHHPRP